MIQNSVSASCKIDVLSLERCNSTTIGYTKEIHVNKNNSEQEAIMQRFKNPTNFCKRRFQITYVIRE